MQRVVLEQLDDLAQPGEDHGRVLFTERERTQAEPGVGHVGDRRETVPGDVTDRETEATIGKRHRGVPVAADDGWAGRRDVPEWPA